MKPLPQNQAAPRGHLTLEALYAAHFEFVYRVASRLGGPHVDAEDVAQEVFVVVSKKLHTYDQRARITTWLYGITLNVARAMRRRAIFRRLFDAKQLPADPSAARVESVDRVEVREAQRVATAILDKMAPKKREVFILAELEELSCEEIGEIVGAKTETVWSRLHYARKEFAERLEAWRAATRTQEGA